MLTLILIVSCTVFPLGIIPWEILIGELLVKYSVEKTLLIKAGLSMGHIIICTPLILFCCRTIPVILILLGIPGEVFLKDIKLIGKLYGNICRENSTSLRSKIKRVFRAFTNLKILNNIGLEFFSGQIAFIMFIGSMFSAGTNLATIRLYNFLPWYIYTICPAIAITDKFIAVMLCRCGVLFSDNTQRVLTEWKAKREIKNNKEGFRTVRALQALRWYNGINGYNFFMLHKPVKIGYLAAIFQLTTDLTMAFPASLFSGIRLK